MSWWKKLFGWGDPTPEAPEAPAEPQAPTPTKPAEKPANRDPEELKALIEAHRLPAMQLVEAPKGASRFGGPPLLPGGAEWPTGDNGPLVFVASIHLPDIDEQAVPWLQRDGTLLFFYDMEEQPWGIYAHERGSWKVLHVPSEFTLEQASGPTLREEPLRFAMKRVTTLAKTDHPQVKALKLTDEDWDTWWAAWEASELQAPDHRIGGHQHSVQDDDMAATCAKHAGGEPEDWRLLLQLDSNEDQDLMWGDFGRLFFFVREQAARDRDFSDVWLQLQCM